MVCFAGLRWQRWAVYQRMKTTERYEYSLQDYIQQNLLGELHNKAAESLASSQALNASVYSGLELELRATEEAEVRAVMKAYYSAFNRQNLDEVRALWLPDEGAELLLPGYEKAVRSSVLERYTWHLSAYQVHYGHCSLRPLYITVEGRARDRRCLQAPSRGI
jgi:hypothetical protein